MVGAGFGLQLLTAGLLMQSFGAYVVLLHDEQGWSKTALSFAYSLQQITSGVLAPAQGWLIDQLGPRAMMRCGVIVFGLAFMAFSQVESLPMFYLVVICLAFGAQMSGFFPVTVAIVNWFERKRARALSTMSIGFGVGGVLVPAGRLLARDLRLAHDGLRVRPLDHHRRPAAVADHAAPPRGLRRGRRRQP